jgi:hypothetical protein
LAKITKYIAICLVLIGTATRAIPQDISSEPYSRVLRQILSLQFEAADNLIKGFAGDPEMGDDMVYLQNYLEFLDALIAGDRPGYEVYLSRAQSRLDSIQSEYGHLSERLPMISAIHLQTSFLNAIHGENFQAARNFYVAKRYYLQTESARPGDPFSDKLEGLINIIAGSAPAEYHWLMKIFGIKGDIQLGLDQLMEYHNGTSGVDRIESCLILLYACQVTGKGTEDQHVDCVEDTVTLHLYFHAYNALKSGRSRKVIELLNNWHQDPEETALSYLDLLLGEALLNSTDPEAKDHLIRFLDRTQGDHYVKTAWHKLSWHHFLEGDSAAYYMARDNVIQEGKGILDADKQAFREASDDGLPNAFLLRSRLYFDGGYYRRSYETLQQVHQGDLANRKDSLEYTYRLARIADRLGEIDEAIAGYHEVVEAETGSTWYFSSNAALLLGMIYEDRGDTAMALGFYQTCLKLNRSAYRNSIGNKAKLGIKRLK